MSDVRIWIRAFTFAAWITAVGSVTMTPLMGFFVGDGRPSVAATALHMLFAVPLMSAALALTVIDRRRRASAVRRQALTLGVARNPVDQFAAARRQAQSAGLPWVESDGTISWPDLRR